MPVRKRKPYMSASPQIEGFVKALIKSGVITKEQAIDAFKVARQSDKSTSQSLVQLGYATEVEVIEAMAKYHRMGAPIHPQPRCYRGAGDSIEYL